jgi:hypothetical protein
MAAANTLLAMSTRFIEGVTRASLEVAGQIKRGLLQRSWSCRTGGIDKSLLFLLLVRLLLLLVAQSCMRSAILVVEHPASCSILFIFLCDIRSKNIIIPSLTQSKHPQHRDFPYQKYSSVAL